MARVLFATVLSVVLLAAPVAAGPALLVKADVPLWSENHPDVWPRALGGDRIGYASIFPFGDWRRIDRKCTAEVGSADCESWWRLELASLFHGGYSLGFAEMRAQLASRSRGDIAVIAELGATRGDQKLFAVQVGFRGGSEYILLSAPATPAVKQATVLDPRCEDAGPHSTIRRGPFSSMFITDYCAVRDREGVLLMARAAANRPPLATLEWVGASEP